MAIEELLTRVAVALEEQNKRLDKMLAGGAAVTTKTGGKAGTTTSGGTKTNVVEITESEVQERVGKYLKTGTAEAREAAKGHVRQIIEHYGAPKFTAIKPAQWAAALTDLDTFAEGGSPEWAASPEGDASDGGDMV